MSVAPQMQRLDAREAGFDAALDRLLDRLPARDEEVRLIVADIITDVRAQGDQALVEHTRRLDRLPCEDGAVPEIGRADLLAALERIPPALRQALEAARDRVREHALQQGLVGFEHRDAHGNRMGVRISPLDRAGIYVPGGRAAYPSSVLMNAVPARAAGVAEVIMCVPTPDGVRNDTVLAAAALAEVDRVFAIGGAQAVAAMAYGTETVPAVDKIVGPGNAFVAEAKRQVFGRVGIDSVAGPSEVCIIADGAVPPEWIVWDLFAQAEHDEEAQSILIAPDADYLDAVAAAIPAALAESGRAEIVATALSARGALIQVRDLAQAVAVSNHIAPEHLELAVADPDALLDGIRHAGAIFLGAHTPEALGDYCAGPNHVLPTSRAARYASPLGTYEFQKRSSIIACSPEGAAQLAPIAGTIADAEGLDAHARSARLREQR
ncbi:MAG: histidinol dehydrogenase [Algiphilus sp.]|uniref:histidinol dehydrogenase n=1 Tax=Algiphilus sp. TaxID=1872431 RepID=UPI0032F0193F